MKAMIKLTLLSIFAIAIVMPVNAGTRTLVKSHKDYQSAVKSARPGDTVVLSKGYWKDVEMVFQGEGTEDKPITLEAEVPGLVIFTGKSNLKIAGNYLVVRGLVFRDGYTPSSEVISFRRSKEHYANNSRVTETVIDHYNRPEKSESDYWVAMYGKNNRFDHNHLVGKANVGVTMAVRLDTEQSRQNSHRIDHNYFGPRPVLGSNGGETLRIGTSAYSMFDSNTLVENNFFDRCNGEVEIISNKSGSNTFRGNVFFESQGTLTLRHGDGNIVEDNIFFGNNKPMTGGIRVINRNQTVRNNYMEGLSGTGFASSLTVMSGVPNSPVNRYVQVSNAIIENNTVINSSPVAFGIGLDAERSLGPIDSKFENNLLSSTSSKSIVSTLGDMSGIQFANNIFASASALPSLTGFAANVTTFERGANGLLYPVANINAGVSKTLKPTKKQETGVSWYAKPDSVMAYGAAGVIDVAPGEDTLSDAVAKAKNGDTLQLQAGIYVVNKILSIDKTLSVRGVKQTNSKSEPVTGIEFSGSTLFELKASARLQLMDVSINGKESPDAVGNAVVRTASYPAAVNVDIELIRTTVSDLNVNAAFNVITLGKNSLAESIKITESSFKNITGSVVEASSETDNFGRYNVDDTVILKSSFINIKGAAVMIYRGGTDESTFGPRVFVKESSFDNVGTASRELIKASIFLHGAQITMIEGNTFTASAPIVIEHTVGEPDTQLSSNNFVGTAPPVLKELNWKGSPRFISNNNTSSGKTL